MTGSLPSTAARELATLAASLEDAVAGGDWAGARELEANLAELVRRLCALLESSARDDRRLLVAALDRVRDLYDRALARLGAERDRLGGELAERRQGFRNAGAYLAVADAAP